MRGRSGGFTLLEVVVAITLLGIAVALASTPFRAGVLARAEVSDDLEAVRLLASAHERIVRELRQVVYVAGGQGFMVFPKTFTAGTTFSTGLCIQRWGPIKAGKLNAAGLPEPLLTYTQVKFDAASGSVSLGSSSVDTTTRSKVRATVQTECDNNTSLATYQTLATGVSALRFDYGGADSTGAGAAMAVTADALYFGADLEWIDVTLTLSRGSGNLTETSRVQLRNTGWSEALY